MERMKIREFIKMDIDIDVCDDYDERCYIAFCGPLELTEDGEREFKSVLDRPIEVEQEEGWASLPADNGQKRRCSKSFSFQQQDTALIHFGIYGSSRRIHHDRYSSISIHVHR